MYNLIMFYPTSSQLAPQVNQIKNETLAQPLAQIRANNMPTLQQTIYGLAPVELTDSAHKFEKNQNQTIISHPRMAPSAITSEEFLIARSSLSPVYNHNMAETRNARISNLHEEMPRFKDQIDLLA